VTVEGDGDLVITGAGPQEVRLRSGSYRLKATKDCKTVKLDRDPVAIPRGDRQIVRVRLEDETPAALAPKVEPGAFVLLGGKGVAGRKFDTLAEAVQAAYDGDTIDVRGNGPFLTPPLRLGNRALTIRAGEGFRPVIKLSPEWAEQRVNLLETQAALVLAGLKLHQVWPGVDGKSYHHVVESGGAPVRGANCRFVLKPTSFEVQAIDRRGRDLRRAVPARTAAWGRSMGSVYPVDSTRGAIAILSTGLARVAEPGQKPNSSWPTATCLPISSALRSPHRVEFVSLCSARRSHRRMSHRSSQAERRKGDR
jgi:hypothetical protein